MVMPPEPPVENKKDEEQVELQPMQPLLLESPPPAMPPHPSWLPGRTAQYLVTILVNLMPFSCGTIFGWPGVAGPMLADMGFSTALVSWGAALPAITGILGGALYGRLAESRGRRETLLLVAVPLAVGWVAQHGGILDGAGTGASVSLLLGRAVLGAAASGALVVCPIYNGEVVEDGLRGMLGSCMPLAINSGVLFVFALGAQVSLSTLAVVCGAVPLLFIAAYPWIPETPVFLLRRGDETAALRSLCLLRDPAPEDTGVLQELAALRASLKQQQEAESAGPAGIRELVATRGGRRGLIIVTGIGALQQLAGISAVLNYAVLIFQMAGSSLAPSAAACVVAAVQLAGSLVAVVLVDRAGRLPLLYASYGGMALSLAVMGACLCWPSALPAWLTVLSLSAYILVFALGAGCMPFLILVEVCPARLRAIAGQFMLYSISALAFVVAKYFPYMADAITPHGVFWAFAAFCAAGVVFVRINIPETKGKPLDDILAELEGFKTSSRSLEQPGATA